MKKSIIALLSIILPCFFVWLPNVYAESSKYDGTWNGKSTGVFITIVIESGTLKSIDAEYLFTNKTDCIREEATFSVGFKGSNIFSKQMPDSVRKDMNIKGDSFSWDLSKLFPGELTINGKFDDEKIVHGTVVSKCPSYNLLWTAVKRSDQVN